MSRLGTETGASRTYNDRDVKHCIRHISGASNHEGDDELADGGAERVREAGEGGGGDAAAVGEPHVGVAGRGAEDEGLGEADEDLAEHDGAEDAGPFLAPVRPGVAHPVAHEDQHRRRHDGRLRPQVQHVEGGGRRHHEREQEPRRQPVDRALRLPVVGGRVLRDGPERHPLCF